MKMQPTTRQPNGGFTLIEVVLAVTILALMTGSIYGIMRTAIMTASDLETAEQQDRSLNHFLELTRSTIESLPPEATMVAALADGSSTIQELTFSGVYDAFSFGEDPVSSSDLIMRLQPYIPPSGDTGGEELYSVSISREDFAPQGEDGELAIRVGTDDELFQADEEGRYWLHLLPEITFMQWQFWDEEQEIWVDVWEDDATRPPMVELRIQPSSRPAPLRIVFDVPAIASTETTTPTTGGGGGGAAAPTDGAGQGGGGGGRGPGGGAQGGDGGDRGPGGGRGGDGGGRGPGFGPGGPGGGGPGGPGRPPGGGPGGGGRPPGGGQGGGGGFGGGGNAGGGNAGGSGGAATGGAGGGANPGGGGGGN